MAAVLADHLDAPQDDLVGLRVLGGVHALVLAGDAPRLARQYPSTGGRPDDDLVPAFLEVLAEDREQVVAWLARPPQTNEVGRGAALVGGLLRVLGGRDLPVLLHEVGASAGLGLNADRYRYGTGADGRWWGPAASPVALADAWRGAAPDPGAPLRVVERHGSDIAPLDLARPGAAERLQAYVWPDQTARLARLRAALEVAAAHPVTVRRLGAADAVRELTLRDGHLTVLWHSIMWQYVPAEEQRAAEDALAALGSGASGEAPLVRLSLEPAAADQGPAGSFVVAATLLARGDDPGARPGVPARPAGRLAALRHPPRGRCLPWGHASRRRPLARSRRRPVRPRRCLVRSRRRLARPRRPVVRWRPARPAGRPHGGRRGGLARRRLRGGAGDGRPRARRRRARGRRGVVRPALGAPAGSRHGRRAGGRVRRRLRRQPPARPRDRRLALGARGGRGGRRGGVGRLGPPGMTRVLVVGGGVAGLLTVQALLDRADDLGVPVSVVHAVHAPGHATASRSGGLALRYASTDPRADGWAARSAVLAGSLARRHPHLRARVRTARAVVVSRRGPVLGHAGDPVDPAALGLPAHRWALRAAPSPQWDTCGLLPLWPAALHADPRVEAQPLPAPLGSRHDLVDLHEAHRADVTVACLGLGAHVLGDTRLHGRLGVLLRGPLPVGTVHAEVAVVDDDDTLRPRYTVPHAGGTGEDHLHVGGTYLPVDDPADWDDPARLRAQALAEVPGLLADAAERFPALAGWRPDAEPWWHLRPVRDTVALARVDPGLVGGHDVVVSHGWGGSGWTIGPAVAEDTARALLPGGGTPDPGSAPGSDPLSVDGWWRP